MGKTTFSWSSTLRFRRRPGATNNKSGAKQQRPAASCVKCSSCSSLAPGLGCAADGLCFDRPPPSSTVVKYIRQRRILDLCTMQPTSAMQAAKRQASNKRLGRTDTAAQNHIQLHSEAFCFFVVFVIVLARVAYFSDMNDSSALDRAGEIFTNINVLAVPPMASAITIVSL